MNLTVIKDRYVEARSTAEDPDLPERYGAAVAAIEADMEPLFGNDIAEWVSGYYRTQYRAWKAGDRDTSLCDCPDPRCRLKRGTLPYQLRRPDPEQSPEEQLRAYLKRHADAVVIDEARTELRELKIDIGDRLARLNRAARAQRQGRTDALPDDLVPDDFSPTETAAPTPSPTGESA